MKRVTVWSKMKRRPRRVVVGVHDERVLGVGRAELGDHVGGRLALEEASQRAARPGEVLPRARPPRPRRHAAERRAGPPSTATPPAAPRRVQHAQRREVGAVDELLVDPDARAPAARKRSAIHARPRPRRASRKAVERGEVRHVGVQGRLGRGVVAPDISLQDYCRLGRTYLNARRWIRSRAMSATDPDCLFCKIVAGEIPATIVASDERTVTFMDINPATRGHALVVPRNHATDLLEIDPEDLAAVAPSRPAAGEKAKATLERRRDQPHQQLRRRWRGRPSSTSTCTSSPATRATPCSCRGSPGPATWTRSAPPASELKEHYA